MSNRRTYNQEHIHRLIAGVTFGILSQAFLNVEALVEADIDDTQKLKVNFSQRDTNRISIDNSRIAQVFGVEELMAIQFDEENGQCFVKAKVNPGHPVTLTLITEEGETQDIEINFTDKPSEVVRLHSIKKGLQPLSETFADEEDSSIHTQAVELIKQLVKNQQPKGLKLVPLANQPSRTLVNGASFQITKQFRGLGVDVRIGTIQNSSDSKLSLKEAQIAEADDVAIYLSQRELHPGQSTSVILIRKRG